MTGNKQSSTQMPEQKPTLSEKKDEPNWWQKAIQVFGVEAPILFIIGVIVGIILTLGSIYASILSNSDLFIKPAIAYAVRETVAAQALATSQHTTLTPTVTSPATPTLIPSQILTITPVPTITPTATMDNTEPILPAGYVYFDNFDKPNDLDSKIWKIYNQHEDCDRIQNMGLLSINCVATSQNVSFDMKPVDVVFLNVSGVAMASRVLSDDDKGSNLALVVTFTGVNDDKRYYYLRSKASQFSVDEVNSKDWKSTQLAEVKMEPGVIHITRVEFKNGILSVWVDDKQIQMQTNLPVNASITNWNIEPIVYCENCGEGNLVANIFWVALLK